MTSYICKNSFEGVLCGVYDAWMGKKGHSQVRLDTEGSFEMSLFVEYISVEESSEKAEKVIKAVRTKICEEAFEKIYIASLSQDTDRADKIYRFLIYGFHYGKRVMNMLTVPAVFDLFQICRNVSSESHQWMEFIRFSETGEGLLFSRIGPKNAVLPLLAPHFSDRLSGETWMIFDENRKQAVLFTPQKGWILCEVDSKMEETIKNWQTDENRYADLWKIFYHEIAIKERTNPACQRTHLPLRYRGYMTEFR